jgi:hypothetical protein
MPSFETSRSTVVAAPPATVRALVAELRAWTKWSPWEELDADLRRTYGGPDEGVGARYAWVGRKAGEGSMVITSATSDRIELDLNFEKPFKANNKVVFRIESKGTATGVTWTMSGTRNVIFAALGKLYFDGMVGKDFEKGLAKLKAVAESGTGGGPQSTASGSPRSERM